MRSLLVLIVLATPFGAVADVIHLAGGQVISGNVLSCKGGDIIVEPPASRSVLVKTADVVSGEGPGIERCLGGRTPDQTFIRGKSYAGEIVVAEASLVLMLALGSGVGSQGLVLASLGGIVLSPPVLHALHGNYGTAAGSLGLHVALGIGGIYLGAALASNGAGECCAQITFGAVLGLLASQVVATTIDVSTFAYEQVPNRFGVGVLLPHPGPDRHPTHNAPPGIQLSVRF